MCNTVLTICVLVYNVEKYLRQPLQSITLPNLSGKYEVIIVNDGSSDKTKEIAQNFVNRYPGIFTLINKEKGGVGSGFNVGVDKAKGMYFKALDGDDQFERKNLSQFIEFLKQCKSDLIITPFHSFDDNSGAMLDRYEYPELSTIHGELKYFESVRTSTEAFLRRTIEKRNVGR